MGVTGNHLHLQMAVGWLAPPGFVYTFGNFLHSADEAMATEIVDFLMKDGDSL